MKIRFFLISITVALLLCVKEGRGFGFITAPAGSYVQSCKNIGMTMEGTGTDLQRIITAECRTNTGTWFKTSITIPVMTSSTTDYALKNNNGRLEIDNG